ncbi:MAG TPA: tRNA dimethylallyltransferase, partial [Candidatus Ozemobacteraceae bacterium]|nr:tRNA dimethylallyltransferase [Candidatus Ozemobacteraceae bacterium]
MVGLGLENEVRHVVETYGWQAPGLRSIGYAEWREYFEGERSRAEVTQLIQQHTRQFAKRQLTWFRHQITGTIVQPDDSASTERFFEQVQEFYLAS